MLKYLLPSSSRLNPFILQSSATLFLSFITDSYLTTPFLDSYKRITLLHAWAALTATWACYLLSKWIDNAFPKNTAYLFPTFISCPFQKHGIKNVTQSKQSKHDCIQVGRILVALNPSTIPQVLYHLVALNCLVSLLFQWVSNKGCRTQKMNLYYPWNQTLDNLKRMAW